MTRIIKFRAWDEYAKLMLDSNEGSNLLIEVTAQGLCLFVSAISGREVIPMQYTGLKDKNGVEIFEGDILLNHLRNQKLTVIWKEDIIGTHGGGWNYKKLENDDEWVWRIEMDKIEVIGNIYQNKNLLT